MTTPIATLPNGQHVGWADAFFERVSAGILAFGVAGNTNPALYLDDSAASAVTGLVVTSAVSGGGVSLTARSPAINEPFSLNAKGTGPLNLNNIAIGAVVIGNVSITGGTITGMQSPTATSDVATKAYVDTVAQGLAIKQSCRLATTANLGATYVNGSSGVGATLTNSGALAALQIDGINTAASDRVLVKNQTAPAQNGVYVVTSIGSGTAAWVLTRVADYDDNVEITEGTGFIVEEGTANVSSFWVETGSGPFTIGTTSIVFTALNVLLTNSDGTITISGNSVSVNLAHVNAWTAQQYFPPSTLTSSAAHTAWNLNAGQCASATLTENTTFDNPTNMQAGGTYVLEIIQAATPKTVAFGTAFKWPGGTAPTVSAGNGAVDILSFYCDGTRMFGVIQNNFS